MKNAYNVLRYVEQVCLRVLAVFNKLFKAAEHRSERAKFTVITINPRNWEVQTERRIRLFWFLERKIFHRKCEF